MRMRIPFKCVWSHLILNILVSLKYETYSKILFPRRIFFFWIFWIRKAYSIRFSPFRVISYMYSVFLQQFILKIPYLEVHISLDMKASNGVVLYLTIRSDSFCFPFNFEKRKKNNRNEKRKIHYNVSHRHYSSICFHYGSNPTDLFIY